MPLQYLAGQRLTADALQRAVPYRIVQDGTQSVTSSISMVDTDIVIDVDDLLRIDLEINYGTAASGGGIRWDWVLTGSTTILSRTIGAAGSTSTGSPPNTSDMYWRSWNQAGSDITVNFMSSAQTFRASETLVVEGSGTMTLQFSQETSAAGATTFINGSYAQITRLAS